MNKLDDELIIILCTVPNDKDTGIRIAKKLLEENLTPCVTMLNNATSLYYWENELKQKHEIQLLIKSYKCLKSSVFETIRKYHPYLNPELIAIPIVGISHEYLTWIYNSLKLYKN
ncbi:divalent cation tolerance protein CutA [Blochmannia endosymbiont of Colobopsis nipponica]|uniref:divalent-cation tolerance protein CutA n=1 Tax=Blochmannia endosymbiont of Colobopsis nipponica TaxID=2681987 RepID=UPI00177DB3D3|nr:divalent cation tolerance protein CutA [Blochmannia endosymbiont of Colobopsis nipponica]QOI10784.1 divalent cation tolerance protein CutA [Blochmannia endosymbiont of Colobopsis nipponica]